MNICPHKYKIKEGQKNGQNGILKHCSEYVIKWEKCNKKISPKFGQWYDSYECHHYRESKSLCIYLLK